MDEELRIVLVGKTGDGKTSTMNTLMGRPGLTGASANSGTTKCEIQRDEKLVVIDTPGIFNNKMTEEELQKEIMKCIMHAAPGPHAIVYVLKHRKLTQEDETTKKVIQSIFGEESKDYTLVLYTCGDEAGIPQDEDNKAVREELGNRLHIFNNKDESPTQVPKLKEMINNMVKENREKNGSAYYTNKMFKEAQKVLEQANKQGMKPTDTPSQDVLEGGVDALLEATVGEPLKTIVKGALGCVEEAVAKCATQ